MYRHDPARYLNISDEYLESVCEWLEEWSREKDAWIMAQFLKKHGIGWTYFKYFLTISPRLTNVFEKTIAGLCEKWLFYAMRAEKLPSHMQKVVMKYLRAYDNHAYDVEIEARKSVAAAAAREAALAEANPDAYRKEDYAKEELEGLYKDIYERNTNKSRS